MHRESTKITLTTINRALRLVAGEQADDVEIADTIVPGLFIRIRKRSVNWALRCRVDGKQYYRTIGSLILLQDPDMVRLAAEKAKAMLRAGDDPSSLFEALKLTPTLADAEALAAHRAGKVWNWEEGREKFLAACRVDNRPDTTRTYKSASGLIDLAPLRGKILTEITPNDIRRIRDSIRVRGKLSQSKLTMRTLKSMFGWFVEQPDSGLKENPTRDVATSVKDKSATLGDAVIAAQAIESSEAERELSARELQLFEAELETVTPPSARLALQLALRTIQRRLTVVSALKSSFRPHPAFGMVWWIHPGLLKVGKTRTGQVRRHPHVIPLPPSAQEVVRTALALTRPDNPFLFPQLRLRRKGDAGDGHLSERVINSALAELQEPGRPLHTLQHFSSHAFRGWFTTHARRLGFSKADAKLILDHNEGRQRDTTDEHYDWAQSLPEKFAILCAWEGLILGSGTNVPINLGGHPSGVSEDSRNDPHALDLFGFGTRN